MRIREEAVEAYAATLPAQSPPAPDLAPGEPDERRAAFQLTLNAINFGSGWFPTLRKQPGMSGFRTDRGRPARPRAVDGGGAGGDRPRRGRRRRSARTRSTS